MPTEAYPRTPAVSPRQFTALGTHQRSYELGYTLTQAPNLRVGDLGPLEIEVGALEIPHPSHLFDSGNQRTDLGSARCGLAISCSSPRDNQQPPELAAKTPKEIAERMVSSRPVRYLTLIPGCQVVERRLEKDPSLARYRLAVDRFPSELSLQLLHFQSCLGVPNSRRERPR